MVQDILDKHSRLELYLTEASIIALVEHGFLISSEQVFTLAPECCLVNVQSILYIDSRMHTFDTLRCSFY